jgi:hypothetical protein
VVPHWCYLAWCLSVSHIKNMNNKLIIYSLLVLFNVFLESLLILILSWILSFILYGTKLVLRQRRNDHSYPVIGVCSFQWTQQTRYRLSSFLRTETDPVSETLCSSEHQMMDKVQKSNNPKWPMFCISAGKKFDHSIKTSYNIYLLLTPEAWNIELGGVIKYESKNSFEIPDSHCDVRYIRYLTTTYHI